MSLRPRARIHLSNIAANWRTIRDFQDHGDVGAVIKADAYGHGLQQVAQTLAEAGCRQFFVAHAFEGLAAREVLGSDPIIYVLNGPDPYSEPTYRENNLTPVINTLENLQYLQAWLRASGPLRDGYVLHFDSGMNRLGLDIASASEIASACAEAPPNLIMTHLACAEQPGSTMNAFQLEHFQTVMDVFPAVPASIANSGGVWLGTDYRAALSRPGYALYGGGTRAAKIPLRPGMTLEAPILQIRTAQRGESVGYGATHTFDAPTLIATVALGYGDGFPRAASNSGFAMLEGLRCPIVGRVSMDLITIDVSAASHLARPGVFAQFIGPDALLDEQAARAGTIGYELTTGLTPRVTRLYED